MKENTNANHNSNNHGESSVTNYKGKIQDSVHVKPGKPPKKEKTSTTSNN